MSAFDKLGLAMIPSGYKGESDPNNAGGFLGRVYSVLPAQGQIDILNIQSVPSWANWDGSVLSTDGNGDTGYINIVQNQEGKGNRTYQLTVTAQLNNTTVKIYATGNVFQNLQEGTNTYTFVHDGSGNNIIRFRVENDSGITLSNMSLVTASDGDFNFSRGSDATRVNSQGLIESIQASGVDDTDIPRLDYSDGCPALLLEPQRKNIVEHSWDTNTWTWGRDANPNNTTRSFGYSAPDGSNNATLFTRNAGTTGWFSWGNITTNVSADFTYSIFVKKGTSNTIELKNVSTSPQSRVVYDFDTDSFTTESNATGKSVAYGNGWYRISMTYANGTAASSQIRHTLEDGESAYVFGSQAEQGSYATSYIPTNGSTVTRLADICNKAGDRSIFNDSQGTLYCEVKVFEEYNSLDYITLSDGSANTIQLYFQQDKLLIRERVNNSVVSSQQITTPYVNSKGQFFKIAVTYSSSGQKYVYFNGQQIANPTNSQGFADGTLKSIDFDVGHGGFKFEEGACRSLLYFNEALTDTELETLTSSNIDQVLKNYQTIGERLGATYESTYVKTKLNELF